MTGEFVCIICGAVVEEKAVSTSPTKKMMLNQRGGVGPRVTKLLHDQGVGTIKTGRLSSPEERLLTRILAEVFWISDKIAVPRYVSEKAGEIARKALSSKVFTRARKTTAAAMVYLACNHHGLCKSIEEIAATADVPVNELNREVGKIVFGLKLKIKPIDVAVLIDRLTRTLELGADTSEMAYEIYRAAAMTKKLSGRKPSAISAAAVYIACKRSNRKTTLNKLADSAGISVLTLRNTVSLLEEILEPRLDPAKSAK